MAGENPLPLLRAIREEARRVKARESERNRLIRDAAEAGYTQEQIANAAGISQSRVQQIITSDW